MHLLRTLSFLWDHSSMIPCCYLSPSLFVFLALFSNMLAQHISSHACLGSSVQTLSLLWCGECRPSALPPLVSCPLQRKWHLGVPAPCPSVRGWQQEAQNSGELCAVLVKTPKLCSFCNKGWEPNSYVTLWPGAALRSHPGAACWAGTGREMGGVPDLSALYMSNSFCLDPSSP